MRLFNNERLLIYLFVAFRLMLLLTYSPVRSYTPGLAAFGDLPYFYELARTASEDKLPYRDYWFEYPPVIALVTQGVYGVVTLRSGGYGSYEVLMALTLTAFDLGCLLLLRRIGSQLYEPATGTALAWIYALMAVPLVITHWTFDAVVSFAMLLALLLLLDGRRDRSALAAAVGALTKLFPLALIAVAWRFWNPRHALRYSLIAGGITAAGFAAMVWFGGKFGLPSLVVQFNKSSSQTVWALLDGNFRTGILSPDHTIPETAYELQGNPARLPVWLRTLVFGGIGLGVFLNTRRRDKKGIVAFLAITMTIFILWSANWSPQWQVTLIPLILLNFPTAGGVLTCLSLGMISFIEYPVLFRYSGGLMAGNSLPLFVMLIAARTGLLIALAVALYQRLREPSSMPIEDVT